MAREDERPEATQCVLSLMVSICSKQLIGLQLTVYGLWTIPVVICMATLKVGILRGNLKMLRGRNKTRTTYGQQAGTGNTVQHLQRGAEGGLH